MNFKLTVHLPDEWSFKNRDWPDKDGENMRPLIFVNLSLLDVGSLGFLVFYLFFLGIFLTIFLTTFWQFFWRFFGNFLDIFLTIFLTNFFWQIILTNFLEFFLTNLNFSEDFKWPIIFSSFPGICKRWILKLYKCFTYNRHLGLLFPKEASLESFCRRRVVLNGFSITMLDTHYWPLLDNNHLPYFAQYVY